MENFRHGLMESTFVFGNSEFIAQRFDYSTADIEASIFFGDSSGENLPETEKEPKDIKGNFRLIDENLFEIANLLPPNTAPIQRTSGLFKLAGF
jgi:hypothetical protein